MSKVLVDIQEKIAIITLNRPAVRNALDRETYTLLIEHLNALSQQPSLHAIILTGGSECFTAGNDLHDFIQKVDEPTEQFKGLLFLSALRATHVPIIAAVEGNAVGIGTTMLLHCDFVCAGNNAVLSMPFTSLGVCPEGGSSHLLAHYVGLRKAQEWLYLSKPIPAIEALEAGLITSVAEPGQALEQAMQIAQRLSKLPLPSLKATRTLFLQNQGFNEQECFEREKKFFRHCLQSEQTQAMIKNFFKNK